MSMILRPARARGHANHGWLDTWHSFSFASYFDPRHMGFRSLRVINDDVIAAGAGFPTHGHADMEIITYVIRGAVAHKDSSGGEGVTARGEVQRMTAGHGIRHSEFNASATEPLRLLQIWLLPEAENLEPGYEQKVFGDDAKRGRLALIASRGGRDGSLHINQDVDLYAAILDGGSVAHTLRPGRGAWVQVAEGTIAVNGQPLAEGDGLAVEGADRLEFTGTGEFLLFDLG